MFKVEIKPDSLTYDVITEASLLDDLGNRIKSMAELNRYEQALIITDTNVAPLYLERVQTSLETNGIRCAACILEAGEESRTVESAELCWDKLIENKMNAATIVIALGGGVITDIATFVAGTFQRGVPLVLVPTTLLGMVDAAIGGKVGINARGIKNLTGTIYQPKAVFCDISTLDTLNEREWRSGLAQLAKTALVANDGLFDWLYENAEAIAESNPSKRDAALVVKAIDWAVHVKAHYVQEDVNDTKGIRAKVKYGHTLGGAIESKCGLGFFSNGVAVAQGMRFAADVALANGVMNEDFYKKHNALLDKLGLPDIWNQVMEKTTPEDLCEGMHFHLTAEAGSVRFMLLEEAGKTKVLNVPYTQIAELLNK